MLLFLSALFKKGLQYSAINTARSALSSFLICGEKTIGSMRVVSRFMRGVFNLRPALVKKNVTWDVGVVLKKLQSLSPVRMLSLRQLTLKLVMLLALLAGLRGQSLHLIDIRNITVNRNLLKIRFGDILKQTRPGFQQEEISIKAYAPNRGICICVVMLEYLERTKPLRGKETKLLISTLKPHAPVARDTVSRWLRTMMREAGVDTSVFSPHSVRAASVSAAKASQVPISTILDTAGWSNAKTFAKYYNKKIKEFGFAEQIQKRV